MGGAPLDVKPKHVVPNLLPPHTKIGLLTGCQPVGAWQRNWILGRSGTPSTGTGTGMVPDRLAAIVVVVVVAVIPAQS